MLLMRDGKEVDVEIHKMTGFHPNAEVTETGKWKVAEQESVGLGISVWRRHFFYGEDQCTFLVIESESTRITTGSKRNLEFINHQVM